MKTLCEFAEQYLAIWNETDAAKRRALIEETFFPDATYRDPAMSSGGHQGIDDMIANAQSHFAGYRFDLVGVPDGHNDVVRFSWSAAAAGSTPVACGTDVATIADGRMRSVTGFLDAVAK